MTSSASRLCAVILWNLCFDLQSIETQSSYRPGAGHVSQGLLQPPAVVVLVQFDHFVVGADLVEDVFGHFTEGAGALGEDHHTVLRHHFLERIKEETSGNGPEEPDNPRQGPKMAELNGK